jgi:hypothetical protein
MKYRVAEYWGENELDERQSFERFSAGSFA